MLLLASALPKCRSAATKLTMKTLKATMSSNISDVCLGKVGVFPGLVEADLLVDLNKGGCSADVELSGQVKGVAVAVLIGDVLSGWASSRCSLAG